MANMERGYTYDRPKFKEFDDGNAQLTGNIFISKGENMKWSTMFFIKGTVAQLKNIDNAIAQAMIEVGKTDEGKQRGVPVMMFYQYIQWASSGEKYRNNPAFDINLKFADHLFIVNPQLFWGHNDIVNKDDTKVDNPLPKKAEVEEGASASTEDNTPNIGETLEAKDTQEVPNNEDVKFEDIQF